MTALRSRLPEGIDLPKATKMIRICLTSLIAIPWSAQAGANQLEATVEEIAERVKSAHKLRKAQKSIKKAQKGSPNMDTTAKTRKPSVRKLAHVGIAIQLAAAAAKAAAELPNAEDEATNQQQRGPQPVPAKPGEAGPEDGTALRL